MSDAGELTIGDLISLAAKNAAGDWEEKFVTDLETRFEQYGERTYLSPKQRAILERIADAVPRFEPLNDKSDDGYVAPAPTLPTYEVYGAMVHQLTLDLGHLIEQHPDAPRLTLDALIRIAADHGWRFAPDAPSNEMKRAWSVHIGGTSAAMAHAETVYREMMQQAPRLRGKS
jgi:hypothetical protein